MKDQKPVASPKKPGSTSELPEEALKKATSGVVYSGGGGGGGQSAEGRL